MEALTDPNAWTPELGNVGWYYDGDKHVPAVEKQSAIIMGFNPGGGRGATAHKLSFSEKMWRTKCNNLTAGFCAKPVFAELIHELSYDKKEFLEKVGNFEPAIRRSAVINLEVIAHHSPNIIFQSGIDSNDFKLFAPFYGLKLADDGIDRPEHPNRPLLRHYSMRDGTAWVSFIHFNTRGFSHKDREAIRDYAAKIVAERGLKPHP